MFVVGLAWSLAQLLTISLRFFDHTRLQTWEPVSMEESGMLFTVFQKRMHLAVGCGSGRSPLVERLFLMAPQPFVDGCVGQKRLILHYSC